MKKSFIVVRRDRKVCVNVQPDVQMVRLGHRHHNKTSQLFRLGNCDIDFFIFCHCFGIMRPKFSKFNFLLNLAKLTRKFPQIFTEFCSICPCHAKWMKFTATFVKTFAKIWRSSSKDFLNSISQSRSNFVPFCLVHEGNLLLCTNIALVYTLLSSQTC